MFIHVLNWIQIGLESIYEQTVSKPAEITEFFIERMRGGNNAMTAFQTLGISESATTADMD